MRPRRIESAAQGVFSHVAALLAMASLSGPAVAQTPGELQRAREEFRQGLALQTAGDYAAALEKFRNVGRVKMTPHVQFNIALCEERMGHLVAALGHYRLALSDAENANLSEVAAPAREGIEALESRIPRLTIRRGSGAEGALIELDGAPIGEALVGTPVLRDPGSHVVTARFGQRVVFEESFALPDGAQHEVVVTAEREEPALAPARPKAGAAVDRTEPSVPEPPSNTRTTLGYVAGGVGIASLVTAGVFIVLRQGAIDELEEQCDGHACPPEAQSTIDRGRLYTGIAEGGVLLGAAGIAVGAVLLLGGEDRPAARTEGRFVSLSLGGPGGLAGARLRGRF